MMESPYDFIGKKVKVDLDELSQENFELDWDPDWSEDGDEMLKSGSGYIPVNSHPYNETPVSEVGGEFDESDNWHVAVGLSFEVDKNNCISSIEFTADVLCPGDSGLGECDPDDVVNDDDYDAAVEFLSSIVETD